MVRRVDQANECATPMARERLYPALMAILHEVIVKPFFRDSIISSIFLLDVS